MGIRGAVPAGDGLAKFPTSRVSLLIHSGLAVVIAWMLGMATGCGSGAGTGLPTGKSPVNTVVTLVGTSTANDQLSDYDLVLNSLTLTDQNGQTVSALTTLLHIEFIHLNGEAEPLATVSLPQGTYTSATATVGVARFDCLSLNSSGAVEVSDFAYGQTPASQVTVNLPAPITIGPSTAALSLNLLVSQSATWTDCAPTGDEPYSITPTFQLSTLATSSQPTNEQMTGLEGFVASVDAAANTFSVTAADGPSCVSPTGSDDCPTGTANGPTWQVDATGNTVFQGITSLSQLQTGALVDMDGSLQPGGSVLASRVAVVDANPDNLTTKIGPVLNVYMPWQVLANFGFEGAGPVATGGGEYFNFIGTAFQVSGQFANLQDLPFTASLAGANMVAGQRLLLTSHATTVQPEPVYAPATTITLLPQTIDGMVSAVSSDSGFDTYTVTLAPYDLFPQFAVQAGQTTLLQNPNTVVVYAGNDTQMLNTDPVAVGDVLRFNGLIFNDNGTLRMDCAWVRDGVKE